MPASSAPSCSMTSAAWPQRQASPGAVVRSTSTAWSPDGRPRNAQLPSKGPPRRGPAPPGLEAHARIRRHEASGDRAEPAQREVGGRLPARNDRYRGDRRPGRVQIGRHPLQAPAAFRIGDRLAVANQHPHALYRDRASDVPVQTRPEIEPTRGAIGAHAGPALPFAAHVQDLLAVAGLERVEVPQEVRRHRRELLVRLKRPPRTDSLQPSIVSCRLRWLRSGGLLSVRLA